MSKSTDFDLVVASQIAYIDAGTENVNVSVKQYYIKHPEMRTNGNAEVYDAIVNGTRYDNWRIVDVQDTNFENGFYACTIDKGDGGAIIGFRGSESGDLNQIIKDWLISDLGLFNSTETPQQEAATQYMNEVYDNFVGKDKNKNGVSFNSFEVAGHSLGGNLAEHGTITCKKEMADMIDRTLSIDGPGYSNEYIKKRAKNIKERCGKIDHYQYSMVGALLFPIPGTNYRTVDAQDDPDKANVMALAFRHDTQNIKFDKNGNMIDGEQDELAQAMSAISKGAEINPSILVGLGINALHNFPAVIATVLYIVLTGKIKDVLNNHQSEKRYEAAASAVFAANPQSIAATAENIQGISDRVRIMQDEICRIDSQISTLVKIASLYTVSAKLKLKEKKVERLSKKLMDLSDKGRECAGLYSWHENSIANKI